MAQTISRHGSFDSCHRVMNECMKCFNVHGHTYLFDLNFACTQMEEIGYAIDFKEIKRVLMEWIDQVYDHGSILNPSDKYMLNVCGALKSKVYVMSLEEGYCNPTVENIAREIAVQIHYLTKHLYGKNLQFDSIKLHETPNCFTVCPILDVPQEQYMRVIAATKEAMDVFIKEKGVKIYDDRLLTASPSIPDGE